MSPASVSLLFHLSQEVDSRCCFAVPTYLYNYVGQPVNTVDRVDSILNQFFNTS
jgi:putative alpha-1,2-mannosidase